MNAETTTKFKGDIVFNDGERDILVSDLATVEEVNEALTQCVTNDKVDTYEKMWMSTEPTMPLYLNPNFEYKDDHVMSSKAVKEFVKYYSGGSGTSLINDLKYDAVMDYPLDSIHKIEHYRYELDFIPGTNKVNAKCVLTDNDGTYTSPEFTLSLEFPDGVIGGEQYVDWYDRTYSEPYWMKFEVYDNKLALQAWKGSFTATANATFTYEINDTIALQRDVNAVDAKIPIIDETNTVLGNNYDPTEKNIMSAKAVDTIITHIATNTYTKTECDELISKCRNINDLTAFRLEPYPQESIINEDNYNYFIIPVEGISKIYIEGIFSSYVDRKDHEFSVYYDFPEEPTNDSYEILYTEPTTKDYVRIYYYNNAYELECRSQGSGPPLSFTVNIYQRVPDELVLKSQLDELLSKITERILALETKQSE